jgi:hypothetical protein
MFLFFSPHFYLFSCIHVNFATKMIVQMDKEQKFHGPALVAINVAARYGVVGEPIPLKATPEWRERLRNFTLRIFDEKGVLVSEGKGDSLLR